MFNTHIAVKLYHRLQSLYKSTVYLKGKVVVFSLFKRTFHKLRSLCERN